MAQAINVNIPGRQPIEIVSYYDEFIDYYPNCEMATKQWFVNNIGDDWVVIDCGANVGYFSVLFGLLAQNGHVFAFEPTSTFEMLEKNLRHNNSTNITPLRCALGNSTGFKCDSIFRIWGNEPEQLEYPFTTIDYFVEQSKLKRIDCIKIDVDSYDFEVLQGAENTLNQFNPYIMVELNHALNKRNQSNTQALKWLLDRGYEHAVVFDDDNFLLKRDCRDALSYTSGIKIFFSNVFKSHPATSVGSIESNATDNYVINKYNLSVPVISTDKLGQIFKETPQFSSVMPIHKSFLNWKMEEDDAPIFRYIYRNFQPRRHLEFGTWQGRGTLYCLEESGATVWTINPPFGESGSYGFYDEEMSEAKAWAKKIGLADANSYASDSLGFIGKAYLERGLGNRVCQIYCDSREWDTSNFPEGFFDTALVDGGHEKDVVTNDTQKAIPLLRSGGIIMWHDFCPTECDNIPACKGVMEAIADQWDYINRQISQLICLLM